MPKIMLMRDSVVAALLLADARRSLARKRPNRTIQRSSPPNLRARKRCEFGDQRADEIGQMRARGCRATRVFCHGVSLAERSPQRLARLVSDPRNLFTDVAAGRASAAQFIYLNRVRHKGFSIIEITAHVIGIQRNISRTQVSGEVDFGRVKKHASSMI